VLVRQLGCLGACHRQAPVRRSATCESSLVGARRPTPRVEPYSWLRPSRPVVSAFSYAPNTWRPAPQTPARPARASLRPQLAADTVAGPPHCRPMPAPPARPRTALAVGVPRAVPAAAPACRSPARDIPGSLRAQTPRRYAGGSSARRVPTRRPTIGPGGSARAGAPNRPQRAQSSRPLRPGPATPGSAGSGPGW
jgi:hypothetical protein